MCNLMLHYVCTFAHDYIKEFTYMHSKVQDADIFWRVVILGATAFFDSHVYLVFFFASDLHYICVTCSLCMNNEYGINVLNSVIFVMLSFTYMLHKLFYKLCLSNCVFLMHKYDIHMTMYLFMDIFFYSVSEVLQVQSFLRY